MRTHPVQSDDRVADLHVHTTASDGRWAPGDVVRRLSELGFSAVGIADHDEIGGIPEAIEAGRACGVEIVPAVELSTAVSGKSGTGTDFPGELVPAPDLPREVHILGYYIDCEAPELLEVLEACRTHRRRRMDVMVDHLAEVGVPIDIDRVHQLAGEGAIGRPHLAQAMVEAGHVRSIEEAFLRYLAPGRPGYAPKWKMTPAEACALVRRIGGVPVLAHPMLLKDDALVGEIIRDGALGLEAYYAYVPAEVTQRYLHMAEQAGLLVTGGSDCHQEDGNVLMGRVRLPYARVEALRARWEALRGK
jgi:predicted metal-dependent phosphoesterase TrpH